MDEVRSDAVGRILRQRAQSTGSAAAALGGGHGLQPPARRRQGPRGADRPASMPRRRGGFGLASLRRELHLHSLFRDSPRRDESASQTVTGIPVSATFSAHLTPSAAPPSVHARRESFLYRSSEDTRDTAPRPVSRASSVTSNDHA
ncbi:unnamed protein product [Angiostrongylus costaricensis]|uniref:Sterile alpha and TIR motif-containing protein 1 n=1 Tax=Angiostrongylus costaricensis TaxID=334426 RepID=A0A0R3PKF9_ANGCS|nr:unnamed protein product [Angiostrongylus costaricensis]